MPTASTNGAQTRNVVVPSWCRVAPSGSAALAMPVAARTTGAKTRRHVASSLIARFPGRIPPSDMDNVSYVDCSLGQRPQGVVKARKGCPGGRVRDINTPRGFGRLLRRNVGSMYGLAGPCQYPSRAHRQL